jgi:hypothetical protein
MRMQVIHRREDLTAWYERLGYRTNGALVKPMGSRYTGCDSGAPGVD